MQYRTVSFMLAFTGLLGVAAHATDVNLSGTVIASACNVDTGSVSQDVNLGRVQKKDLQTVGSGGDWQPFQVKLVSCPAATRAATAHFSGTPFSGDPTLYSNTGDAQGVAVQMTQAADKTQVQGDGSSMTVTIDAQRNATYALAGRVIRPATDTVVPGTVSSVVQMNFTYQ